MRAERRRSVTFVSAAALIVAVLIVLTLLPFTPLACAQLPPGIPRGDILVVRCEFRSAVPDDMNIWKPGVTNLAVGGAPIFEPLWFLNVTNMKLVPMLASAPPEYEANFTIMRVRIRPGVYWSDGVEFTADDVVFTLKLHLNVTGLSQSAFVQTWVEDAYAEDRYTVAIKLKKPNPKFHLTFTTVLGIGAFTIMPKHVWEKVSDPLTFKFNPPVGTGPYVLDTYDPAGYWALYRRRDDWERSATGKVLGKPKPEYILRIYYAADDPKQIIAMSRHELDFTELTLEMWDTIKAANPYVSAYWPGYPYAWMQGICDHGPVFNLAKYPFNITDVRWALTLAINITEVEITAFDGKARIATFRSLSLPYLQPFYEPKLLPWIRNFTLSDGYKPFDETVAYKLAKYAESKGYTLPADPVKIWGLGWWRYDPAEAAKLLEKHGFYKDKEGKWHLPSGEVWKIDFLIPTWHVLGSRIGYAIVEQWRKFGIDITDEALEAGVYGSRYNTGDFDVLVQWPFCSAHVDTWQWWQGFHVRYLKPLGQVATSNQMRWNSSRFSELMDQLSMLQPEDPKVIDLVAEALKVSIEEMPVINLFLGSKLIVFDTYVWKNWPTADKWYWEPAYWNAQWILPILVKLEPTGNVPSSELVAPPTVPAVPSELSATVSSLVNETKMLKTDLETLKTEMDILRTQISFLNTIIAVEAVVIIALVIGFAFSIAKGRKKG